MKCKHEDNKGNSLVIDDTCSRCGEEVGYAFLKKQKEKKKDKRNIQREEE